MTLLRSFFLGGFECATHRRGDGVRVDVQAWSGHDIRAAEDYAALQRHGMRAARDGLRWHLIERRSGQYDWSSLLPLLRASRETETQVIWDLCHYGLPSGLDIWSTRFVERFAAFAGAAARVIAAETPGPHFYTPINEISFWSFVADTGGWDMAGAVGRGGVLKRQLARAFLAGAAAVRAADPDAAVATAEPAIHIWRKSEAPADVEQARIYNESQFEAVDLLLGRREPELGGSEAVVDLIGLNYYYNNQWIDHGPGVYLGDWLHRPFHQLLVEQAARYAGKPLYVAETGTEGVFRPYWLQYVADEVAQAIDRGAPVQGICLYPVLSHRGWDDARHCPNGMFESWTPDCERRAHAPMSAELARQVARFAARPIAQAA